MGLGRVERLHKIAQARELYAADKSIRAIAQELGHAHRTIAEWLDLEKTTRRREQDAQRARSKALARQRLDEGCSITDIARELRVDKSTITKWLWPEKRKPRVDRSKEKRAAERKARDEMEAKLMPYDRFKIMMARGEM